MDSQFVHKIGNEDDLSKKVPGGTPFPMIADGGGPIGAMYGVYDEGAGVAIRGRFLIDPDGVVQAREVRTSPVGRRADETIGQIKAFQLARETGGKQVCPDWQPGKKTLQPGPELVGQVWKVWSPKDQ